MFLVGASFQGSINERPGRFPSSPEYSRNVGESGPTSGAVWRAGTVIVAVYCNPIGIVRSTSGPFIWLNPFAWERGRALLGEQLFDGIQRLVGL